MIMSQPSNFQLSSASFRVHRTFNRIGIVLGAIPGALGVLILVNGINQWWPATESQSNGWPLIAGAAVIYALCRGIGWIVAGAMKT